MMRFMFEWKSLQNDDVTLMHSISATQLMKEQRINGGTYLGVEKAVEEEYEKPLKSKYISECK